MVTSHLITGGAGYIGSHVVRAFLREGLNPVVLDNYSTGFSTRVPPTVPAVLGDVLDTELVEDTLNRYNVSSVVHLAGYKNVGESVRHPLRCYEQNVGGIMSLLKAMENADVREIVFSSSAAVYGTPDSEFVDETSPTRPESPYGETKLVCEQLIQHCDDVRSTSLRYFNVAGNAPGLGDTSPYSLFACVLRDLVEGRRPTIYGSDYLTPDGTCVRDFIDVRDLAEAHVQAALRDVGPLYNISSGIGVSVRQVMNAFAVVSGIDFEPALAGRRDGDLASVVATGQRALRDLGWTPRHTLIDMVQAAWDSRVLREPA